MDVKGYQGSVSFDGAVVTISKRLRGDVAVPVGKVQAVEIVRAGIGMRAIRLSVAGGTISGRAEPIGSHRQMARDPYALTFRAGRVEEFRQLQRQIMAAGTQPPHRA